MTTTDPNRRALGLLDEMGNLTITWDASSDVQMAGIIQKKLDQGLCFMIVERMDTLLDRPADCTILRISDADIDRLYLQGKVDIYERALACVINAVSFSTNAEEIAQSHAVAVIPFTGGMQ